MTVIHFVHRPLISRYRLRDGVVLEGFLRPGKKGDLQVSRLTKVMNIAPEAWSRLHEFKEGADHLPGDEA